MDQFSTVFEQLMKETNDIKQVIQLWANFLHYKEGIPVPNSIIKNTENFKINLSSFLDSKLDRYDYSEIIRRFLDFSREFKMVEFSIPEKTINNYFTDHRFTNYCWGKIKSDLITFRIAKHSKSSTGHFGNDDVFDISNPNYTNASALLFDANAFSNNMRKESVIPTIQSLNCISTHKLELIKYWHEKWVKNKFEDPMWLKKQTKENVFWICERIIKEYRKFNGDNIDFNDAYWNVLMLLDLEEDKYKREVIIYKTKRALSQRKYRDKNQDIKSYSVGMTEETKAKIDSLAKKEKTTIQQLISNAIDHYSEKY